MNFFQSTKVARAVDTAGKTLFSFAPVGVSQILYAFVRSAGEMRKPNDAILQTLISISFTAFALLVALPDSRYLKMIDQKGYTKWYALGLSMPAIVGSIYYVAALCPVEWTLDQTLDEFHRRAFLAAICSFFWAMFMIFKILNTARDIDRAHPVSHFKEGGR